MTEGSVSGAVRTWLRLEGLAAGAVAVLLYHGAGHPWTMFALLFLAPDLSFAAYAAGPRVGSVVYNIMHSYATPLVLALVLILTQRPLAIPMIWCAHIGFDRVLGYGLKYPSAFTSTHLGRIGRREAR